MLPTLKIRVYIKKKGERWKWILEDIKYGRMRGVCLFEYSKCNWITKEELDSLFQAIFGTKGEHSVQSQIWIIAHNDMSVKFGVQRVVIQTKVE